MIFFQISQIKGFKLLLDHEFIHNKALKLDALSLVLLSRMISFAVEKSRSTEVDVAVMLKTSFAILANVG